MHIIHSACAFCGKPVSRRSQGASKNVQRHYCDISCKSEFQKLAKPVSREWLETKYVTEGLDCVQIAMLVSRDSKSVWNWLKDFGIPTRPRGHDTSRLPHGHKPGAFKHTQEAKDKMRAQAIADGRVPYDPTVGSYMKGRKGAASTNWKGGVTPERQALYSSPEWAEAVKAVWARANASCERCGVHHNTTEKRGTFHVHHIVSFAVKELRAETSNLALLCNICHRFVHSRANVLREFIREIDNASSEPENNG